MAERKKPAKLPRARAKATQQKAGKRKADAAAKRAAGAGATGKRLPSAKAALRNSMIVARAAQGVAWGEIAKEAGVSARTCQRIVEQARDVPSPLDATPMQLLEGFARGFERSIVDFETLAFAWADSNPSAALGAKKAADETRARLAALMTDVGKLPDNLELFRSEMEMQRIAEAMHEKLLTLARGEITVEEALHFYGDLLMRRDQRALPESTSA